MEDVKPGIYKHFKNKKYKVLYTAINSETQEEEVVYQALYGEGKIWTRPKKNFLEEVEIDGQKKSRFEYIVEENNDLVDLTNFEDRYKRALADYQNLLKRTAQEKMEFAKFANEQLLNELLPVYDNLKTSMAHANEKSLNSWLEGIKYVIKQFKDALAVNGVEEIATEGEKFDHSTMEALSNEETDDESKDGIVAKEVKAGYKLNGKVIVPARVVVYKLKVESEKL